MNNFEDGLTKIAPRIPGIVAAICFAFLAYFSGPLWFVWGIFWGAGLVDLLWGSLGLSEISDTQRAAKAWDVNPNVIRILGFVVFVVSALFGFGLLL
jgi:hypothetical protein